MQMAKQKRGWKKREEKALLEKNNNHRVLFTRGSFRKCQQEEYK